MSKKFLLTLDHQFPDRKIKQNLLEEIDLSTDNLFITRGKPKSELLNYWIVLDKLEIKPDNKVSVEDLLSYFRNNNLHYSHRNLEKGFYAYFCGGVHFVYNHFSFGKINKIFVNPFMFPNTIEAINSLVEYTPTECLKSYKISRVDICLMIFDRSYQEVKESLWIEGKQNIELIKRTPKGVQSQYFGERPKKVLLYDKLAKNPQFNQEHKLLNKHKHHIRCEIHLTKDAVPSKKLEELIPALLDKGFNPFKRIRYEQINFKRPNNRSKEKIWERYYELRTLTRHIGIQYASSSIKLFTENFNRDYKKEFISPEWKIHFSETYHHKIFQSIFGKLEANHA